MAVMSEDSVCSSCYAMTGRYCYSAVLAAQFRRFAWCQAEVERDAQSWAEFMAATIKGHCCTLPYFRVHDSGDFFSLSYIRAWTEVVRLCPGVKFWFPTRAWRFPHWLPALRLLAAEPNVSLKLSSFGFDEPAPVLPGFSDNGSAVLKDTAELEGYTVCPKSLKKKAGNCAEEGCRACWDGVSRIAYKQHGYSVSPKIVQLRVSAKEKCTQSLH